MIIPVRYDTVFPLYPYQKVPDQSLQAKRHPVVVVGGGPVGLALALDLGKRGTSALLLDDHEGAGNGSKAICFSKRSLDISHRLGAAQKMMEKGVVWNVGRVFHGRGEIYAFDLLPDTGHRHPAFINLQQPYFEKFLAEAIEEAISGGAPIEMRGRNLVSGIDDKGDHVVLNVETPDGPYQIEADYVVACDGARSPVRAMLGLGFEGRVFEDNFLIADVRMTAGFPSERWFWFNPPFDGAGQSALLHKQPDDVWRIDFQLGWDIDRDAELEETRVRSRVNAMLASQTGAAPDYELVWTSIYTFQCRRMKQFRHGRIFFAGDSAHQVSPFGARGANSGLQDAENLAWKLNCVLNQSGPDALLDTYSPERVYGADENILNSSRTTDFLTPKSAASKAFRNAALDLAKTCPFARTFVNSGRLSVPCIYDGFPGFETDGFDGPALSRPGAPCPDAPVEEGFLLDHLRDDFTLLVIGTDAPDQVDNVEILRISRISDELRSRYLGNSPGAIYLVRPDQHVVARWPRFDGEAVQRAIRSALGAS